MVTRNSILILLFKRKILFDLALKLRRLVLHLDGS